jgi:hypothetical protein
MDFASQYAKVVVLLVRVLLLRFSLKNFLNKLDI